MKGIFIVLDGVSDLPIMSLGQKTPLEVAKTPNLDELSKKSKIDYCYTVKEGVAPQSSNAMISLLGYNPNFVPRGPLEAQGAGIKITNGDLVLRTNFASVDNLENLNILDRRAGRTLSTKEAKRLAKAINQKVKLPHKFEFYSTNQHRGVLVIRGGFSENITNVDPAYGSGVVSNYGGKIQFSRPMDDEDDAKLSAELVNNFVRQSYKVLDEHPINKKRAKKGLYSANIILCRDAGNKPVKLKKMKGKWMALCYMPLETGIAKATGMNSYKFKYPKMRGIDIYSNLYSGLRAAIKNSIKMLRKNRDKYDYFYIHLKETDIPGHDNKPLDKVKMIELIDERFFDFVKQFVGNNKLVVTADHTTACKLKNHTDDPVPVLSYPYYGKARQSPDRRFTEKDAKEGKKLIGRKVLEEKLFRK